MSFSPDLILALAILAAVGAAAFLGRRQGVANPVGTAKLQRDVTELSARLVSVEGAVNTRLGNVETAMQGIRADLDDSPTKADIARVEGQIGTVGAVAEKTDQAVVRIEQLLLDRALPRRGR